MRPNDADNPRRRGSTLGWFLFGVFAVVAFVLGMLASSITERRNESVQARLQLLKPIAQFEADNSKWGINFPREYNSWESTKNMSTLTKYGGSKPRDHIEAHPLLPVLWAGFSFAKDYQAPRGHMWALQDVTSTQRVNSSTAGTCMTCKSPDVPRIMARDGVEAFYSSKFVDLKNEVKNPIGCADCHNNETMALQISRPALKEAFQRMGKDVTKATHQEMRSLVCAQCHVTYYFKDKKSNYLIFPWDEGFTADDMDRYYTKNGFVEWTHAISGAKMLKMRHPDYEVYLQGTHAFRGVSCTDCHMPYKSEGGIKFTDHQIRSPLENVANSCQVCHRWSEEDVKSKVYSIQDKNAEMLANAEEALAALHLEIGDAMKLGAKDAELESARTAVRRGQMYWDYVAANNGMGFHAPQECARVLDKATKLAYEGRLDVNRIRAKYGAIAPLKMPDLTSKEKSQAYIKPYVDVVKKN